VSSVAERGTRGRINEASVNPYVAEAAAALVAKGYTHDEAKLIIDRFLAANPNDEHRLFAALNLGTSAVTEGDLLLAARHDSELAQKAYVRQLLPDDTTVDHYLRSSSSGSGSAVPLAGGGLLIPLALVGAAIYFWRR